MEIKTFLNFLPVNFRHEKTFLISQKLYDIEKLCNLTDLEINNIQRESSLCTLNNLKKIRAIAVFKKKLAISPPEAYLLLHSGIGSLKSLSRITPSQLEQKIRRLERSLRVKTTSTITLSVLKDWINKARQIC